MARHPDLSIRVPESTSLSHAVAFNKVKVDVIFNLQRTFTVSA